MVAAPVDHGSGTDWGCWGTYIGGTDNGVSTGQANTTLIVDGCAAPGIAARLCDDLIYDGYEDWFLPSKDELNLMYENLADNGIGSFSSANYWSSTEEDGSLFNAWRQNFIVGNQLPSVKSANSIYVRAVRAF